MQLILKNEDQIKECGKRANPASASNLNRARCSIMFEMQRILTLFIDNNVQGRVLISWAVIQQKATRLYDELKKMP